MTGMSIFKTIGPASAGALGEAFVCIGFQIVATMDDEIMIHDCVYYICIVTERNTYD
ncbi:hypothetical protein JHK85_010133 [Glycine max]|nr:hypothetical protein JHK85_010133 [Glycine max]